MNQTIIIGSLTYTQKAKRALMSAGIRGRLIQLEDGTRRGCAYGIEIPEADYLTSIAILRREGIVYRGSV